jgi:predicted metal-dependent hydrolase
MPDFVVDYLISHEVAHLVHQDHSQNFWSCVDSICPQNKKARKWLKDNASNLNCFN